MKLINFSKIKKWIIEYKKISILLIIILVFVGYKTVQGLSSTTGEIKYITEIAKKGTIISTITGTGQVSASNRIDVISEVSGDVIYVPVKLGDVVKKDQTIAQLDNRNASRTVKNAELNLESAKIAYDKALKQSKDQAINSSVSDLKKEYDKGYNEVVSAFIDIPDIIAGLDLIFYNYTHSPYFNDINIQLNAGQIAIDYKYEAGRTFDQAKKDYDLNLKNYKTTYINSDPEKIVSLVEETYNIVKKISTALAETYNTVDYIKSKTPVNYISNEIAVDKNTLSSFITKTNSHTTNLSNVLTDIENAKDTATTATLNLKSAELNVSEAEDTLREAREVLWNHRIKAPFDGIIGKVSVENGDKISTNETVAVMITDEKEAEISLNEVDVANIKMGDKVNITFDAIDDLTITGKVIEIDLLGTVEQGVVNYTIKISFDLNDKRVKTGMSLNASIITDSKDNILIVPNSAIKSQKSMSYVEVLSDNLPKPVKVETGISNDGFTEIISGLNEGDRYISKSIIQSNTKTTTQAPSLFGGGVRSTSGENSVRVQMR